MSGTAVGARSSKVTFTFSSGGAPAADIRIVFWPVGPETRESISCGKPWLMFANVTATFPTVPVTPEMLIVDGYGRAVLTSRMTIAPVLEKLRVFGKPKTKLTGGFVAGLPP